MYILHHGHDDGRDDHGHGDHDGGRGHDRDSRMYILHHGRGDGDDAHGRDDDAHDGGRGHDHDSRMYILHHGRGDVHDVRGHGDHDDDAHDGDHGRDDDAFLLQEVFQQNHCLFPLHVRFLHHQCHPMLLLQLSLYHLSREAIPMFFQVYLHSASVYG